jgi:predicted enzyme related to lactoylglutathione lyase
MQAGLNVSWAVNTREFGMKVHYLEIVTSDVDAVCAAYEAAHGIKFGSADLLLGGARTAPLPDGGSIGVRAPLRDTEKPVVRPYWLVDDIQAALDAATKQGALVAHPPLEIPGKGRFAIYIQGDVNHGLWQL